MFVNKDMRREKLEIHRPFPHENTREFKGFRDITRRVSEEEWETD